HLDPCTTATASHYRQDGIEWNLSHNIRANGRRTTEVQRPYQYRRDNCAGRDDDWLWRAARGHLQTAAIDPRRRGGQRIEVGPDGPGRNPDNVAAIYVDSNPLVVSTAIQYVPR